MPRRPRHSEDEDAEMMAEEMLERVERGDAVEDEEDEGAGEVKSPGPEATAAAEAAAADRREQEQAAKIELKKRIMAERLRQNKRDGKGKSTRRSYAGIIADFLVHVWRMRPDLLTDEFKNEFKPGPEFDLEEPPSNDAIRPRCPDVVKDPADTIPDPFKWDDREALKDSLVHYTATLVDEGRITTGDTVTAKRNAFRSLCTSFGQQAAYAEIKEASEDEFKSLRRKLAKKLQQGEGDMSTGATPLPFEVYCALLDLVMEHCIAGNGHNDGQFMHTYMTLLWNLACRTSNAKHIRLSHLKWDGDALVVYFAHMKNDQEGSKKGHARHIYANPVKPAICPILSLGLWWILAGLDVRDGHLFPGKAQDTRYNTSLQNFAERVNLDEILRDLGIEELQKLASHSCRKGAITFASSGTTACPSYVAVTIRGGWTLPGVDGTYRQYQEAGDQFMGRTLAGLLSTSTDFMLLPPMFRHVFNDEHPMPAVTKEYLKQHGQEHPQLIGDAVRDLIEIRTFLPPAGPPAGKQAEEEQEQEQEQEQEEEEEGSDHDVDDAHTPQRRSKGRGGRRRKRSPPSRPATREELPVDERGFPAQLFKVAEMGLASVLYHLDFLKEKLPAKHRLWSVSLLRETPRLEALRALVWCGLSGDPIAEMHNIRATGIPPHTMMLSDLLHLAEGQERLMEEIERMKGSMNESMRTAIHEAVREGLVQGEPLTTGNAQSAITSVLKETGILELVEYVRQHKQGGSGGSPAAGTETASDEAGYEPVKGMVPTFSIKTAWMAFKSGKHALCKYMPADLVDSGATEQQQKQQRKQWSRFRAFNKKVEGLIKKDHPALYEPGAVDKERASRMFEAVEGAVRGTSARSMQLTWRTAYNSLEKRQREEATPAVAVKRRRRNGT